MRVEFGLNDFWCLFDDLRNPLDVVGALGITIGNLIFLFGDNAFLQIKQYLFELLFFVYLINHMLNQFNFNKIKYELHDQRLHDKRETEAHLHGSHIVVFQDLHD